MKKSKLIFLLFAVLCFAGKSFAQTVRPCYTTEMYKKYLQIHPEIAGYEKQLTEQTIRYYQSHPEAMSRFGRTSATSDTMYYNIPVVFHVMHDYGAELNYLTDNYLFGLIDEMNQVYAGLNNTASIIAPFQKFIGKSVIRFHLATTDPSGNLTNGITHRRTYLTYGGDDMAKLDLWSPANYYNIWFENVIGGGEDAGGGITLAYANFPSNAAAYPFNDGVISRYDANAFSGYTIEHETGHYFNLLHPWNNNGAGGGQINSGCGDDDVDDTPPTTGHFSTCPLYDTTCATNYYKIYTNIAGGDSLVNYPDTTNVQNIMDYSSCTDMFTKGQVQRMYAALNSNIGNRNNLYDSTNLINTGVWNSSFALVPRPDPKPIPDFNASTSGTTYLNKIKYFVFPSTDSIIFRNQSWNDTITSVAWTFSNGAKYPTSNATTFLYNSFTEPGWVSVGLTATGNHSGDSTITWPNAVFVANTTAANGATYLESFDPAYDRVQWPTFNYYNNRFRWQYNDNVGFDDNHSIEYLGYDSTLNPALFVYPANGTPGGDIDDLFSVPMDLSSFSDTCNLNFFFSAASRSSNAADINDSMVISYSVFRGSSWVWVPLVTLSKTSLINKGASAIPYAPTSQADWTPMSIGLPAAARNNYVTFRFRYFPGNGPSVGYYGSTGFYSMSSGNNYYMDRINFARTPAAVDNVKLTNIDVAVVPNPTNGDAYVVIKDANNAVAKVVVTDITGKAVYSTSQQLNGSEAHILIPHSAITVAGIYLVQTTTGSQSLTKKLVVY